MNKLQLQTILSSPYNQESWKQTLINIFGVKRILETPQAIELKGTQKATEAYELGSFSTKDDRIIGIYQVNVKPDVWLEHNKVGLRELLRDVYKYDVDGALIAFVQENKWRLSFVSEIKTLNAKGAIETQTTEPKRYTYLLGEGEKTLTPAQNLSKIAGKPLTLEDIRNAFSVEALNEEFYKIIAQHFYELVGATAGKGKNIRIYERKLQLPSTSDAKTYQEFAVRLIGRTIFCWFLKVKKSQEGLALLPECLLGSEAVSKFSNYYHTVLERLFFQTLNTPMEKRVNDLPEGANMIPFLNGGLFDYQEDDFYIPNKITGLSENLNTLIIPDSWFLNFFQELDKYNFTIDENSTVDIEVSVDPEMLGRIFENLLAEIDPDSGETARKATGSFYTPREIVDYMATESLVHYLHNKTNLEKEVLSILFKIDSRIPEDSILITQKVAILEALDTLKILDPACGSGAFPMGVLQKIVMALQKIDPNSVWWKNKQIEKNDNPVLRSIIREKLNAASVEYARKIGIIQNSLYGVDIQPIAAEISKLRCFLTLIVDENIDENKPNRGVEPLPNLEFKFVTADSLRKLPVETNFGGLFNANDDLDQLKRIRQDYLQSFGEEKAILKTKFKQIQDRVAQQQFSLGKNIDTNSRAYLISTWKPFSHEKSEWFDAEWMFGVSGFDIVIGNPPYVQLQTDGGRLAKMYEKVRYSTFERTGDIYTLFYEQGYNVLSNNGLLCFITSNKWMRAGYGESLRRFFAEKTNPIILLDFAGQKIFASATVDTNILLYQKSINVGNTQACIIKEKWSGALDVYVKNNNSICNFNSSNSWVILNDIEQSIKAKIERIGTPLKDWDINIYRGILTGYNDAFIIDGKKKDELIAADPKSAEIIRPILRGRDIKRYGYEFADLWLLYIPWHFPLHLNNNIMGASAEAEKEFEKQYPAVYKHLLTHKEKLSARNKEETGVRYEWYALQRWGANYMDDFSKPKIIWKRIGSILKFSYDESSIITLDSTCFATGSTRLKYILSILNSKMGHYLLKDSPKTGTGDLLISVQAIEPIKVPVVDDEINLKIMPLVDKILSTNINEEAQILLQKINKLIYKLYQLDENEIQFIENQQIESLNNQN
ncbi:Eco57I restriction-modification methylase domain-containing protein [Flectobacillus roseus]|uniref:site-specific DNA-methyltransferase (adenine-specific) n=1 Tax=Flectobacillus roseus TaxID=502259 RepID=A0ABT6Y6Y3_9BACT|nr:Eco57I restriction-modification methylase domain-containing protein [Flectobacillus roseus]MDI9859327.1 Eco57I restriction-modification methylase domain-containing protein [Flectobacillus roseus]